MFKRVLLAAALSAVAGQAAAQSADGARVEIGEPAQGLAYYNRPGATVAEHNAALAACMRDTAVVTDVSADMTLVEYLIWNGPIKGGIAASVENCMLVRGWRVFRAPDAEGAAAARLNGEAFAAVVGPWIGTAAPPGVMVRSWANEAARPAGYRTASMARTPSRNHLSIKLFGDTDPELPPTDPSSFQRRFARTARPEHLAPPAPGKAIILVRTTGANTSMHFEEAARAEGALWTTYIANSDRRGRWTSMEVTPGRYRIAQVGVINLCLGAPSFEVAAGEIVYAGAFDLSGPQIGPDMDMASAAALAQGAAAERLRPAAYRNGSTASCRRPNLPYAMEFPGAEFEAGYVGGSRAAAPAP